MEISQSARIVRRIYADYREETQNIGGELARQVDAQGERALLGLLSGKELAVELEDGELLVTVTRMGAEVEVASRWETGEWVRVRVPGTEGTPIEDLDRALSDLDRPLYRAQGQWWWTPPAGAAIDQVVPAITPETLGNPRFQKLLGTRYAHAVGAMAGGIAGVRLVQAAGDAGLIGFFGAGGLSPNQVAAASQELGMGGVVGANLLHSPQEPALEERAVDSYLDAGIRVVDASAFMSLTPAVVRYRLHGIHEQDGKIILPNRLFAKISRAEVAELFLKPPPLKILDELVARWVLTPQQAQLAARIPMADGLTVEADSGGHTDGRPLIVMLPVIRRLAEKLVLPDWDRVLVGAAGGIGDPYSLAAALTLGADYTMTGSINQATVEADTSELVKVLLASAGYADMARGPAPDMFEIGAKVQVLGKGTMYAQRAQRLYEVYVSAGSIEEISAEDRAKIEKQIFQRSFEDVWADTVAFWRERDPQEIVRAEADPRHKLALCFRWYLGLSSRWARVGEQGRKRDFQIWCGPSMGLFNDWVRGTELENVKNRTVAAVNLALLRGACRVLRAQASQAGSQAPRYLPAFG